MCSPERNDGSQQQNNMNSIIRSALLGQAQPSPIRELSIDTESGAVLYSTDVHTLFLQAMLILYSSLVFTACATDSFACTCRKRVQV